MRVEELIRSIEERYSADNGDGGNVTWVDIKLLTLVKLLLERITELEDRETAAISPYDALMIMERAKGGS